MKIFLLLFVLASSAVVSAGNKVFKICLTGSTEKSIPAYGEAFWNGAVLAKEMLPKSMRDKLELELHYYESSPLAPIEKLREMRKVNCSAIIGFSTGNDLIAIEDELAKEPVLTMSIYGDPQERFKKTSYLRTIQPSAEELVSHLFSKLPSKITNKNRVLVITANDRSEMKEYKAAYTKALSGLTKNVHFVDVLEQTHDISAFIDYYKKNKNWDFVVILARSLIAAKIADEISSGNSANKPIILGTKYFGSNELPAFYNFLKDKNIVAFFSRQNCSCDSSPAFLEFTNLYKKRFSLNPMLISADTFDTVTYLAHAINNLTDYSPPNVINFFSQKGPTFIGKGSLVVRDQFLVTAEKRFLMKVTRDGYEGIK